VAVSFTHLLCIVSSMKQDKSEYYSEHFPVARLHIVIVVLITFLGSNDSALCRLNQVLFVYVQNAGILQNNSVIVPDPPITNFIYLLLKFFPDVLSQSIFIIVISGWNRCFFQFVNQLAELFGKTIFFYFKVTPVVTGR
tara:strand:+ start:4996 stop:5412 length:417 start_codon:yes stop_codon:yes gene_type:complete